MGAPLVSGLLKRSRNFRYHGSTATKTSQFANTGEVYDRVVTNVKPWGNQTTWSQDTLFPTFQRYRAQARAEGEDSPITRNRSDIGGQFLTERRTYRDNGCSTTVVTLPDELWVGSIYRYSGPIMAVDPLAGADGLGNYPKYSLAALDQEMIVKGTTAIARTVPTNPSVGVGTLIGETLDRRPSIPGAAVFGKSGNVSKRFADEYLNSEFALKPLVSDIKGMAQTVKNTNRILKQLERDSGRLVRRRYTFPVERSIEVLKDETWANVSYPLMHTRNYGAAGLYSLRRQTTKRMWFSGAYTYYYHQGDKLWDKLLRNEQAANRLFGLRLTPDLIWELTPWSWAADWVTNAGDVLKNISAFSRDGLVLNWGYMMCDLTITDTHILRVNTRQGAIHRPIQRFTTRVKRRIPATPYGFGMDPGWSDLSSRQLSILGALGISRAR
jgi:hypothetical protein